MDPLLAAPGVDRTVPSSARVMNLQPEDASDGGFAWLEEPGGPRDGGRLPCRTTDGRRLPAYVEPHRRNLLQHMTKLPYELVLFDAERTIAMHGSTARRETRRDKHAPWRDVLVGTTATYEPRRCGACTDDGCVLLDTAMAFQFADAPTTAQMRRDAA